MVVSAEIGKAQVESSFPLLVCTYVCLIHKVCVCVCVCVSCSTTVTNNKNNNNNINNSNTRACSCNISYTAFVKHYIFLSVCFFGYASTTFQNFSLT